jgi:6-pyruvoyl-tetrahydropterin synthase
MVCDFKVIKEIMGPFLDGYDHAMCVNTDDPAFPQLKAAYGDRVIGFDGTERTTEVLAKTIYAPPRCSTSAAVAGRRVRRTRAGAAGKEDLGGSIMANAPPARTGEHASSPCRWSNR